MSKWIFYIFFSCLVLWRMNDPFFWDTIQLGSKHAHWYFENGFHLFFLPAEMDSGHIPYFGMLLASIWSFFGKSQWISHLMMLPFIFLIIRGAEGIMNEIGLNKLSPYAQALILLHPNLLGQSVMVSSDTVLISFFVFGLYCILKKKDSKLWLIYIWLILISNRGLVSIATLVLIHASFKYWNGTGIKEYLKSSAWLVLPAFLVFSAYHIAHWNTLGWVFYHDGSPWAPSFEKVAFQGILKNAAVMVWRYLDMGNIAVIVTGFYLVFKGSLISYSPFLKSLITGLVAFVFFSSLTTLHFESLTGLRYYMPGIILFTLITIIQIKDISMDIARKRACLIALSAFLILGNFLVYPEGISQSWDSSLAHLPYHEQRDELIEHIGNRGINLEDVGTAFPNRSLLKYTDLSLSEESFAFKDLSTQDYIYYSNVFNEFTDEEISELKNNWKVDTCFYSRTVYSCLYFK